MFVIMHISTCQWIHGCLHIDRSALKYEPHNHIIIYKYIIETSLIIYYSLHIFHLVCFCIQRSRKIKKNIFSFFTLKNIAKYLKWSSKENSHDLSNQLSKTTAWSSLIIIVTKESPRRNPDSDQKEAHRF